jgi:MarR family transcriptional regulator for hemolysin
METFAFQVVETGRHLRRDFDRRASALGVTRSQWRVLLRLGRTDGARQVELADALDVEPITLCRMVDRLEEAGLVERRRDGADRRAWNIFLTPKSAPLIRELQGVGDMLHADALAGISEKEQAAALDVLARVRFNLNRKGDEVARKAS